MTKPDERLPIGIISANTIGFALSFAVWIIFGPSNRLISNELHLSLSQAALLKSTPILIGSTMRIPVGILTDRFGARLMFPLLMIFGGLAALGASLGNSFQSIMAFGVCLGMVGSTFAVGAQSVSSWTPKHKQGTALGIFGAGNIGTAITTLGLPFLLTAYGWRAGFQVYAGVLGIGAAAYAMIVRNAPKNGVRLTFAQLLAPIKLGQTWRFSLYYMATFGVFVAGALTFSDIYTEGYHLTPQLAGILTTTFTFSSSLMRIVGGKLADRFGARLVTRVCLLGVCAFLAPVALGVSLPLCVTFIFAAGTAMGIGMASVIRYVPEYFPGTVGAVTGIVGAIGGVGGFLLPLVSAALKQKTGSPYAGIFPLSGLAAFAFFVQYVAIRRSMLNAANEAAASVKLSRAA